MYCQYHLIDDAAVFNDLTKMLRVRFQIRRRMLPTKNVVRDFYRVFA